MISLILKKSTLLILFLSLVLNSKFVNAEIYQEIKVEGNQHLYRDEDNFAIINKDTNALNKARMIKNRIKTQDSEINTLKEEINEMKDILLQINERLKWQEQ